MCSCREKDKGKRGVDRGGERVRSDEQKGEPERVKEEKTAEKEKQHKLTVIRKVEGMACRGG